MGNERFRDNKPLRFHLPAAGYEKGACRIARLSRTLLLPERRHWFSHYRGQDVAAFRVVKTGSVGVRDFIVLMFGAAMNDPLFIQD